METHSHTRPAQPTTLGRNEAGVFLAIGFGVWLVVTLAVRMAGPSLLQPGTPLVTAGLYLLQIPAMALLALAVFRLRGVTGTERVLAGIVLVLPGMVLDSLVVPFFGSVFPTVDPSMAGAFGGILLLAYAVVLETAYLTR